MLFCLYFAGIISAMGVAWFMKRSMGAKRNQPLMLELPAYHWPHARNLAIGLWERAKIFLSRVGGIILTLMVLLWALSSFQARRKAPPIRRSGTAWRASWAAAWR